MLMLFYNKTRVFAEEFSYFLVDNEASNAHGVRIAYLCR